MADLNELIKNLSIRHNEEQKEEDYDKEDKFSNELKKTGFQIIKPIKNLGYFAWKPTKTMKSSIVRSYSYKSLNDISSKDEILCSIDYDGKPDRLQPIKSIQTPKLFENPPNNEFQNEFPFGKIDIACLHVAVKRGVDLNEMNFAFGGSTLEMLATKDASDRYIASQIPGTKCILVVKRKDYIKNLADVGFQFERYVTGGDMHDSSCFDQVEHLYLANVGSHKVLFRAEVDAIDSDGNPVEVKASNPKYFGTRVMFQMISSGSSSLCHGQRFRRTLNSVTLKSLSTVAKDALYTSNKKILETNILEGMDALHHQMKNEGVFSISFHGGKLKLTQESSKQFALLPSKKVVESLINFE